MKNQLLKFSLKKTTIAKVSLSKTNEIKGGSSLPTDFDNITFRDGCPSHSK